MIEKRKDNIPLKTERVSLHLPKDTIDTLRRLAAKNGTNLSKEIRHAIDGYLDIEVSAENIGLINGVIKEELTATDILLLKKLKRRLGKRRLHTPIKRTPTP